MALISSFSRCAICHELLGDLPYLATSAVAYPFCDDDPLYPLYDTPLHWDCYEPWPARPRFARQYVSAVAENDSRNPYCGEALRTNLMYLSVHLRFRRYGEPPPERGAGRSLGVAARDGNLRQGAALKVGRLALGSGRDRRDGWVYEETPPSA